MEPLQGHDGIIMAIINTLTHTLFLFVYVRRYGCLYWWQLFRQLSWLPPLIFHSPRVLL